MVMGIVKNFSRTVLPYDVFKLIESFIFGDYSNICVIAACVNGVHTALAGEERPIFDQAANQPSAEIIPLSGNLRKDSANGS